MKNWLSDLLASLGLKKPADELEVIVKEEPKVEQRRISPDFGCDKCADEDPEKAAEWRYKFITVADLIQESHFSIRIRQCPECQQKWLYIFTEVMNFSHGDDSQYWSVVPINDEEVILLENCTSESELVTCAQALGRERTYLIVDYPAGSPKRIAWSNGGLSIGSHD